MGPETGNGPPGLVQFLAGDLGELDFLRKELGLGSRGPEQK